MVPKRVDRTDLASAVGEAVARITGRPWRGIEGTGRRIPDLVPRTTARSVVALLRALEWPDLAEWLTDARLVAEAAHRCPHPLFARDVRAEGWVGGVDRSRSVQTLTASTRWADRVAVALQWAEAGKPATDWPAPIAVNGHAPRGWKPPIRTPEDWLNLKF